MKFLGQNIVPSRSHPRSGKRTHHCKRVILTEKNNTSWFLVKRSLPSAKKSLPNSNVEHGVHPNETS